MPPSGFAGLTDEELRAMEGQERQNLEARLQCLQNIHTLLDAAMVQIHQYLSVVATLSSFPCGTIALILVINISRFGITYGISPLLIVEDHPWP
eukprot:g31271.t1